MVIIFNVTYINGESGYFYGFVMIEVSRLVVVVLVTRFLPIIVNLFDFF